MGALRSRIETDGTEFATATRALRAGELAERVVVASSLRAMSRTRIENLKSRRVKPPASGSRTCRKITWMLREHRSLQSAYVHCWWRPQCGNALLDTVEDKSFWHFYQEMVRHLRQASFDPTYLTFTLRCLGPMVRNVLYI
jgi:hypothetical protein